MWFHMYDPSLHTTFEKENFVWRRNMMLKTRLTSMSLAITVKQLLISRMHFIALGSVYWAHKIQLFYFIACNHRKYFMDINFSLPRVHWQKRQNYGNSFALDGRTWGVCHYESLRALSVICNLSTLSYSLNLRHNRGKIAIIMNELCNSIKSLPFYTFYCSVGCLMKLCFLSWVLLFVEIYEFFL
jgi:hypothetical protein